MSNKEEALKVLEQDALERKQKCWEEILEILKKYNMKFDITTAINNNSGVRHFLDIIPQ